MRSAGSSARWAAERATNSRAPSSCGRRVASRRGRSGRGPRSAAGGGRRRGVRATRRRDGRAMRWRRRGRAAPDGRLQGRGLALGQGRHHDPAETGSPAAISLRSPVAAAAKPASCVSPAISAATMPRPPRHGPEPGRPERHRAEARPRITRPFRSSTHRSVPADPRRGAGGGHGSPSPSSDGRPAPR